MRKWHSLNKLTVTSLLYVLLVCRAKIIRNNALMNKMMSQFQKDNSNNLSLEPAPAATHQQPDQVLTMMQDVLCRNFPTIPCRLIMQDKTLSRLIQKSIQQINNKKMTLDMTTRSYEYKTNFPIINSEDLSNFLQVQNTGYFDEIEEKQKKRKHKANAAKNSWSQENLKDSKIQKNTKHTSVYGRKKLRKFYPHKVKYKDKKTRNPKPDFRDSGEKVSLSVEIPDMPLARQHQHYAYKREPADPAVWRIDYAKHGEAGLNLLGSITKTGRKGMVQENIMNVARKDVMHPDVYIKKNFIRKNSELVE